MLDRFSRRRIAFEGFMNETTVDRGDPGIRPATGAHFTAIAERLGLPPPPPPPDQPVH
jgi:hypothetical protein